MRKFKLSFLILRIKFNQNMNHFLFFKIKALKHGVAGMLFLLIGTSVFAQQVGIFQTYAIVNRGGGNEYRAGGFNADGAQTYQSWDMGSFFPNQTLVLNGGEIKTWKNSGGDVQGAEIYFRVYPFGTNANLASFTLIDLPFNQNLPNSGDQKWARTAHNVNLLSGRSTGLWVLEVYWRIRSNVGDRFDTRLGQNFQALFTVRAPEAAGSISGPSSACAGASNLQLSTAAVAGATSYQWTLPSGYSIVAGAGTNSITVNLSANASSGNISVAGVNSAGTGTSSSRNFTVNPRPAAPQISSNTGSFNFCVGSSVTLSSNYATGNSWSNGQNTQSIVLNVSSIVSVTHTDANGCVSQPSGIEVSERDLPAAPTINASGSTTLCSGGTVTLTSSYPSGNTWNTGAQTASIQVSAAGTYSVVHTDANGCSSAPSNSVQVSVNPGVSPCSFAQLNASKQYNPTVFNDGNASFCSPVTLLVPQTITVTSGNAGNHWSFIRYTNQNGQNITLVYRGGSSQAHPAGTTQINLGQRWNFFGAYLNYNGALPPNQPATGLQANQPFTTSALRLTVNGSNRFGTTEGRVNFVNQTPGCNFARIAPQTESDLGFPTLSDKSRLIVYPNPSTDDFRIESNSGSGMMNVEVWDTYGRLVESLEINETGQMNFGSSYKPGVYILRYTGENFSEISRILKK